MKTLKAISQVRKHTNSAFTCSSSATHKPHVKTSGYSVERPQKQAWFDVLQVATRVSCNSWQVLNMVSMAPAVDKLKTSGPRMSSMLWVGVMSHMMSHHKGM